MSSAARKIAKRQERQQEKQKKIKPLTRKQIFSHHVESLFFGALAETKTALDVFKEKLVEHAETEERQVAHAKALLAILYGHLDSCLDFLSPHSDHQLRLKHRRVRNLLSTYKTFFLKHEEEINDYQEIESFTSLVQLVIDYISDFHTLLHEDTHGNKRNAIVRKTQKELLNEEAA
tara:strand:- start:112 stop:639 length:528 start_codon:yes stop_codon:yes gene_type:complete